MEAAETNFVSHRGFYSVTLFLKTGIRKDFSDEPGRKSGTNLEEVMGTENTEEPYQAG